MVKIKHGIYIRPPYNQLFAERKINAFIKPIRVNLKDEYIYICSGGFAYGIAKITDVKRLTKQEIKDTYNEHKIDVGMKTIWWGNKRTYYYPFKTIKVFKKPVKYNYIIVSSKYHFLENVKLMEHAITNTK